MRSTGMHALAAAAALSIAAAGCGGQGGASSAFRDTHPLPADTMTVPTAEIGHYGGRFVLAQTSGPKTFNPMVANENSSVDVCDRLFASLTNFDNATQHDYPELARGWDVSADGRTWTWHLRRGACFSDGHPITSDDVLFSFAVAYDSTLHPAVQELLKVNGQKFEISAPDSYTVVTTIAAPYVLMSDAIGSLRILPKHVLEPAFKAGRFASAYSVSTPPESLVTSGAWTLKQYVPNEKTVLTRNPYWCGVDAQGHRLPYLDELTWLIVPDQNTAALKFQSGDLDGLDDVRPEDYASYEQNQAKGNYTLYDLGPSLNSYFVFFNLNRVTKAAPGKKVGAPSVGPVKYAWFSNPGFRRAVSMAIDRDAIIKSVYFGQGVKNWMPITPASKTWSNDSIRGPDFDQEGARKLLASLGFKDRDGDGVLEDAGGHKVEFTITTNTGNNVRVQILNFIRDDLAKVGIQCTPSPLDFNTLLNNVRVSFDYDACLLGGSGGVPPDPGMVQNVWRSSGATHYWHVKEPKPDTPAEAEIDRLVAANVATTDLAERKRTWDRLATIVNEQTFVVWIPSTRLKVPVRNRFGNVQPTVIPHRLLWNIDRVFVKTRGMRA